MRTMGRGRQFIIMSERNNVITEAGSLTRLIGKGVSQLITLDPPPPHSRITLSSICTAVKHESWPHPLRCQSCQEDTPTHGSHGCTCGLQENDHLFILLWTNLSILLIILIWIEILTEIITQFFYNVVWLQLLNVFYVLQEVKKYRPYTFTLWCPHLKGGIHYTIYFPRRMQSRK